MMDSAAIREAVAVFDDADLADDPATPREAPVTDTDLRQGRVLGTSLAATIAAFAAAGLPWRQAGWRRRLPRPLRQAA